MSNFKRDTASQALEQIMLSEDATEWRPRGEGAEILLSDGEWLPVSAQRIAESASEIRTGDVHVDLRPRLRQIASYGIHTDEIGIVSKITKTGFYVRTTSRFPSVPGGRIHPSKSRFFTFEELGQGAVKLS